ncbi:unnamed protein product [Cuscuta europaea]|uniref:Uncharacterized protein n=1 Tax=Cuscuta europaea TaxID=41803 RepID=A0A9P0ZJQ9_CUSEU|nr:unnamed protein product [Cuscuta europaea]
MALVQHLQTGASTIPDHSEGSAEEVMHISRKITSSNHKRTEREFPGHSPKGLDRAEHQPWLKVQRFTHDQSCQRGWGSNHQLPYVNNIHLCFSYTSSKYAFYVILHIIFQA